MSLQHPLPRIGRGWRNVSVAAQLTQSSEQVAFGVTFNMSVGDLIQYASGLVKSMP